MKPTFLIAAMAASLITAATAFAAPPSVPANIAAAVADPGRPKEDTERDALRHPAEVLAFAGVKPGDSVVDFLPGGGYFTRILSKAVGPTGHVYAFAPAEFANAVPQAVAGVKAIAADPAYANVTCVGAPSNARGFLRVWRAGSGASVCPA
jgi:predicted methyltransferase